MNRILIIGICIICICLNSGCSQSPEPPPESIVSESLEQSPKPLPSESESPESLSEENEEAVRKALSQFIDNYLLEGNFSGSVLIMQGENIILRKAYDMADLENNMENKIDTPFRLCSLTKQFTGAAILTLEADGKIDTLDTLDKFFSGYDGLENVAVSDLLIMKGGFGDSTGYVDSLEKAEEHEKIRELTVEDMEAYILTNWKGEKLDNFSYSNSDYYLLGRIIEQVSGMAYDEYVTERLFKPVGMLNSGFVGSHEMAMPGGDSVPPYDNKKTLDWPFCVSYSAGGIVSTVDDLGLWLDAYFGGDLFDKSMLAQITGSYNYGWYLQNSPTWNHGGASPGFRTFILYDQDSDTKIVLLSSGREFSRFNSFVREISRRSLNKILRF